MIRKPVAAILLIILCGTVGLAQNIDKDTYDNLVDYCNCVYASAYIKQLYLNRESRVFTIVSVLDSCKINGHLNYNDLNELIKQTACLRVAKAYKENRNHIDVTKQNDDELIKSLLIKKGDEYVSMIFSSAINPSLKIEITNSLDYNNKIKTGTRQDATPNVQGINTLQNVTINTQNNKTKFKINDTCFLGFTLDPNGSACKKIKWSSNNTDAVEILNADSAKCTITFKKVGEVKIKVTVDKKTSDLVTFTVDKESLPFDRSFFIKLLGGLVIIVLAFFAYKFRKQIGELIRWLKSFKKPKEEAPKITEPKPQEEKTIKINEQTCRTVFKWILKDENNFATFSNYIMENEQICFLWINSALKFPKIRKMIEEKIPPKEIVKAAPIRTNTNEQDTKKDVSKPQSPDYNFVLYADSIFDGFFHRVSKESNEDTVFELHPQYAQTAIFTIFGSAESRVIANPYFLEGCEKQVLKNAQHVHIEQKGEAQKQPDGRWKITKKLNVVIE